MVTFQITFQILKDIYFSLSNRFYFEAAKVRNIAEMPRRRVFVKLENGEAEEVALWKWFKEESLKEFEKVYKMLNIQFDSYAGESFYSDKIPAAVAQLEEKGLLKESQNSIIVDLDQFGLVPALVKKSDGSTLYITRDIAAALYRKDTYDFYKCLYVVASQQDLHFNTAAKKLYEHYLGKEEKEKWSFNRQSDSGSNYNIGYETR